MWSSNIKITDITLRDSPFWTIHPYDCKNVIIRNVTILTPLSDAPNTDGIDPGMFASRFRIIIFVTVSVVTRICFKAYCHILVSEYG